MIRIASEKELLESFRLIDRAEVELPGNGRFPMVIRDYLAWSEPSGNRLFLVLADRERQLPLGIVFRRDQSGGSGPARMCEWCHAVRSGDGVTLLTAASSSHRRVGLNLCRDLSCKDRLEEAPGVDDLPRLLSDQERLRRILRRMSAFARQNLY